MPDEEVDAVYAPSDKDLNHAKWSGYRIFLAGDFNAEIGRRTPDDDPAVTGDNPMPNRSERGELLLQWCTLHNFAVLNSFGCDDCSTAWTFKNGKFEKATRRHTRRYEAGKTHGQLSCRAAFGYRLGP